MISSNLFEDLICSRECESSVYFWLADNLGDASRSLPMIFLLQNPRVLEGFQKGLLKGSLKGFSKGFRRVPERFLEGFQKGSVEDPS